MKKKIVVTGAHGQLGSELRDILGVNANYECAFLDVAELDLTNTDTIQDRLTDYHPDIIIHGAAYTAVDKAESEQELADKINHLATAEIAKYSASHGCKLIAISTDYVFDGNSSVALTEDSAVDPINVYGKTKLDGEHAIASVLADAIIVRTAWVYSVYGNNFVKTMIRLMSEREELSVINDQIGS
ncbi:SDR family oxidoreductase, partial [Sphingobacterium sp. HJSM2_6]|uniref:SDR family oxidoreductase n=1 Tax=Sphingobacterium sp. HJSM2_6 TaxID=3366264 RepID=UPI003BEAD6BC